MTSPSPGWGSGVSRNTGPPTPSFPNGPPDPTDSAAVNRYNYERKNAAQSGVRVTRLGTNNRATKRWAEVVSTTVVNNTTDRATWENPPFDKRITRTYNPDGVKIKQGYLIQDKRALGETGYPVTVRFLYNPSDITVAYASGLFYDAAAMDPNDNAKLQIPNMQTISFRLQFDRMYETASLQANNNSDRERLSKGVRADVEMLERACGIIDGEGGLARIPCFLYFGVPTGSDIAATGSDRGNARWLEANPGVKGMQYYGYVSAMTVTYGHFTYNMTPNRCIVDLEFTQTVQSVMVSALDYSPKTKEEIDAETLGTEVTGDQG